MFNKDVKILQKYFDKTYYLLNNEDVKHSNSNPYEHYKIFGSKEGRNPNKWFDVKYYVDVNKDINLNNSSAFLHYLQFGWKEKRLPNDYTSIELYKNINLLDDIHAYFYKDDFIKESEEVDTKDIKAHIDKYEKGILMGWAYSVSDPTKRVLLDIFVDEEKRGEVLADKYRPDLEKLFNNDGKHGFFLKIDNLPLSPKLGLITLKEKSSGDIILTNSFSIKYNLAYFFEDDEDRKGMVLSEGLPPEHYLAVEYYKANEFEKSKQLIETFLEKSESLPEELYLYLLKIYLSENNYFAITELYLFIIKSDFLKYIYNEVHEEILSFCSNLWMVTQGEYIVIEDAHRLEILLVILDEVPNLSEKQFLNKSKDMHNFLAFLVKSSTLLDEFIIEKLSCLIVEERYCINESNSEKSIYIDELPFLQLLNNAIHTVDSTKLNEINLNIHLLAEYPNTIFIKELFLLYITYVEVLINANQLSQENVESILKQINKYVSKFVDNTNILNIIFMDLFYIIGEEKKLLELFYNSLDNLADLDWKCKYLPEILWLYFKNSAYKVEHGELIKLLYRRYEDQRTTYIENTIILSDIQRYENSVNLPILFNIVKKLTANFFYEDSEEIFEFMKELLNKLLYGTLDTQLLEMKSLKNYIGSEDSNIDIKLYDSEIFELLNLYSISILNSNKPCTLIGRIDKKYKGLFLKEKREQFYIDENAKESGKSVAVLTVVNDSYEKKYLLYYKSMLQFSQNKYIKIYLYFSKYYFILGFKNNKIEEIKEYYSNMVIDNFNKINYDMYMILNQDSIVHHNLMDSMVFDVNSYYCFKDEYSFCITNSQFKYFQDINKQYKHKSMFDYIFGLRKKLSEYIKLEHITYIKNQQGILSFNSIEPEEIELLSNYEYSVFKLDDIEKSLLYLIEIYTDSRVENIVNINIDDVSMNLLKPFNIGEKENDIACFLVQRNEYLRLEGFLSYYRELGVDKFYIVDNASDDGKTLDYILGQDDVEVYSTLQAYSQSLFGVKWIELLIQTKRVNRWNIVADADELLIIDKKFNTLREQCEDLEKNGFDSLYAPFIDMYSDLPVSKTSYSKGADILNTCSYYDKHFYTFFTPHGGSRGSMNTYQGGLRSRTFNLYSVILNKVPLFKFNTKHKLREGLHWIDNSSPAYGKAVLLHFKYIETFHQYVVSEIKRGQHWNGASEYWQYHHFLNRNPDFSFYNHTLSQKFTTVELFYKEMFRPFSLKGENQNV